MTANVFSMRRIGVFLMLLASMQATFAFATPTALAPRGGNTKNAKKVATAIMPNKNKKFTSSPLFLSSPSSTTKNVINGATPPVQDDSEESSSSMFARLRQISNVASFLCVLDCTLLPIITIALPLLGVINLGEAQLEVLHHLGHKLALYFVLPVGGLTSAINFSSHRKAWITSIAGLGLLMVGLANSHIHHLPLVGHSVEHVLHLIQHGPMHRVVNIMGCACLLGSNYLSQQQGCAHHDHSSSSSSSTSTSCSHDHSPAEHKHD
jgi:uncharacterized membrane protein YiaA